MNIIIHTTKKLFITVLILGVGYQMWHTSLLLATDDSECCPCMQLKMFGATLDKTSCCDCPNGFHLHFFVKDMIIESLYDFSWLIVVLVSVGTVLYSSWKLICYSTQSRWHFVNVILFVMIASYMSINEKDGGLTKLFGKSTMYSVCNFKCTLYDSKKTTATCYSHCIDEYMNGDYLRLVGKSRMTVTEMYQYVGRVCEYAENVSEYAQTQYNATTEMFSSMYEDIMSNYVMNGTDTDTDTNKTES